MKGNVVCAWCGKVMRYDPRIAPGELSHGMCEECKTTIQKEMKGEQNVAQR